MIDGEIKKLSLEIQELEQQLNKRKEQLHVLLSSKTKCNYSNTLSCYQISKYCRQMILPDIGVNGQLQLERSKVLIVGAGGLGCPCALYLAAAGVGCIGLIDHDSISLSNLHRQILYEESDIGQSKVETAKKRLQAKFPELQVNTYTSGLTPTNCVTVVSEYNIVIDCSDNVAVRYLVNDVCVLLKTPLIVGNAIKIEGQYFSIIPTKTPCYRCVFPQAPDPVCVGTCSDDGVLGVATGVIGVLQALEAIKVICEKDISGQLTTFDNGEFRSIKFRARRGDCDVCGENAKITLDNFADYLPDAEMYKPVLYPPQKVLTDHQFIKVSDLRQLTENDFKTNYLLIDVRPSLEYEMFSLKHSINWPIDEILKEKDKIQKITQIIQDTQPNTIEKQSKDISVMIICHNGNDSQRTVRVLQDSLDKQADDSTQKIRLKDVYGGLTAWHHFVDEHLPLY